MSKMKQIKNLTDEELLNICDSFPSASAYLRSIGINNSNGRYTSEINRRRERLNLEWKTKHIDRICPICNKRFRVLPSENKQTCSRSCSNTLFPRRSPGEFNYRAICFSYHKKECIICGESNIVAVHHYDENHENNEITNLIPMCPTHHQYMHSGFKHLIEDKVKEYIASIV